MHELDRKIVAHEMAPIEVVAHVEADHIRAGIEAIRSGFVIGITEEERVIQCAAIDLLEAALLRFDNAAGLFIFGDPKPAIPGYG